MSDFTDIQQGIEALSQKLGELDDQRGKSDEYMLYLTNEVEDRVRQNQAEMVQNRTDYERIMREHEQAGRLLRSLEQLALKASRRSYPTGIPTGIFSDFDAITKALATANAANVTGEAADPGAIGDEDSLEVDPDHLRRGIRCLLKKKGIGVPEEAEAPESAT